jgi:prevent-host-death family protein
MKTATVADLRNQFARISRDLLAGESITITKRGRPFAVLAPAHQPNSAAPGPINHLARLEKIYADGPVKSSTAPGGVLDESRGDR